MNREKTEKAIDVMQAYVDGKEVQFKRIDSRKAWEDFKPWSTPIWDWYCFDYRVKPEPIVRWAALSTENEVIVLYRTKEEAERSSWDRIVKLVEVEDD